ncbi:MAG: 2,3-diaminopropionate biosynthesis protein SbnB [Chitinophagaceae bacterium]
MLLLNEEDIKQTGIDWNKTIAAVEEAVQCMEQNDFAQPIKPYLRYRNLKNRIIAMPAFVGGNINMAGIKWIASFPGNIDKGIPRAHSVVILNNADTGEPLGIINTPLLSIIRTASVTGLVIKYYAQARSLSNLRVGITGFGPIGQYHLKMCTALLGDKIDKISLYDIRSIDASLIKEYKNVEIVNSWQDAYENADIFITCTVSDAPYIDKPPKPGSLHLNVSLRDYKTSVFDWFKDAIIVDEWEEVCREKTDIEMLHIEKGLNKEGTKSIIDVVKERCIENIPADYPVMFNPMGMAVFDIAVGSYYYRANV